MEYQIIQPKNFSENLIKSIQKFRNSVYTLDSVHFLPEDDLIDYFSWHILCRSDSELIGCLRYTQTNRTHDHVGGWAVHPDFQKSRISIQLIFIGFAIGQFLGGRLVKAEATIRHGSYQILSRIGGKIYEEYYDPKYECVMYSLEFDTLKFPQKYQKMIEYGLNLIPERP